MNKSGSCGLETHTKVERQHVFPQVFKARSLSALFCHVQTEADKTKEISTTEKMMFNQSICLPILVDRIRCTATT